MSLLGWGWGWGWGEFVGDLIKSLGNRRITLETLLITQENIAISTKNVGHLLKPVGKDYISCIDGYKLLEHIL